MNKTSLLIIGGVLVIVIAGAAQFLFPRSAVSPTIPTATSTPEQVSTTTTPIVATTTVNVTKRPATNPLPIVAGDTIASWNFQGAYSGNPDLVAKAQAEIKRLSEILVTATSSAMILTVGSIGSEVKALQQFLNARGYTVAASGPGSPGNETTRFGSATKAALIKYQKAKGITPAVGYFGAKTRAAVNSGS